jgi:hypothetical protein
MRMHIRLITLLRFQILIFILCGSGFLFDAGPDLDLTFHSDQDPDRSLHIKAQTHRVRKKPGLKKKPAQWVFFGGGFFFFFVFFLLYLPRRESL